MDTLMSIKTFRQVIESSNFVTAAERLDMSTAMVSKHVMHIEPRSQQVERALVLPRRLARVVSAAAVALLAVSAAPSVWS